MRGRRVCTAERRVHQVFRGQSRPLKRALVRRWIALQACPRPVAVMFIQLVFFRVQRRQRLGEAFEDEGDVGKAGLCKFIRLRKIRQKADTLRCPSRWQGK